MMDVGSLDPASQFSLGFPPLHHQQQTPAHRPSHPCLDSIHEAFPFGLGQDYGSSHGRHPFQPSKKAKNPTPHCLMNILTALQHNIRQLQTTLLPLTEPPEQHAPDALSKQQAVAEGVASAVLQVVVAAASVFRQVFGSTMQNMASDLQLINLLAGSGLGLLQQTMDVPLASSLSSNYCLNQGQALHMAASDILGSDLGISDMGELQHVEEKDAGRFPFQNNMDYIIGSYFDMDVATNRHPEVDNGHMENLAKAGLRSADEHESTESLKDEEDDGDTENLPPGSYDLIEMNDAEILAEHTHFCKICGKGFKRDANLRMHMRGHGDEYKTPAALSRPTECSQDSTVMRLRRYSCPFVGCKRNKSHKKFQPLKTLHCVKNHYRRSHCDKIHACRKCKAKKFSVLADLKTHEKHCGCDMWRCSCGTTFSRKDKLLGHVGLFAGHTPALPLHEVEGMDIAFAPANHFPGAGSGHRSDLLLG